ncbi:MAG: leucine-rich repeat protein [Clostridia bacterium]|nr:leucine-rich repeat protein [Clostridia bacterium]
MKKIIRILAAAFLFLMPSLAFASEQYMDSSYRYEIKEDGTVKIIDFLLKSSRSYVPQPVVIPSEIDGKTVTEIGERAFEWASTVYDVVVPGSVQEIGPFAFEHSEICQVTLEEGVEKIGHFAFSNTPLESIHLPDSLTSIEFGAFQYCEKLQTIRFPEKITEIESGMLSGCIALNEVELHDGIVRIEYGVFENCSSLAEIRLPNNEQLLLEETAFSGSGLKSIRLPKKCARYRLTDDVLYDVDSMTALYALKSGRTRYSISKGTKQIASSAFINHPNVTHVDLPETVVEIRDDAFRDCCALEEIVLPDSLQCIGNAAFSGCIHLRHVKLPRALTVLQEGVFRDCCALEEIEFPESLQRIDDWAFDGCSSLTHVVVPGNVKELGDAVFESCTSLKKLILSEGIERIGDLSLLGCNRISEIVIPRSAETVDNIAKGYNISVYVYRDSAAHQYVRKWNENYVVIDDISDIPDQPGITDLIGKKWASFSTPTGIRIDIDEQRMQYIYRIDSHTTGVVLEEYDIDGDVITSTFFGWANPSMVYRFISDDMIVLLDRTGNNYEALLVRAPGDEGTGLVGEWDAYRYKTIYEFTDDGKVIETGSNDSFGTAGPFESEYWIDGEIMQINHGEEQLSCYQQAPDLIRAATATETGYFIVMENRDDESVEASEKNAAVEGRITSSDWTRGTWSDTARYGLLEAVFCYRDSDRIPGGVAITGVSINPDSVEEYSVQSLAFPNTVDGRPVVGIEAGCCENILEFSEVAWPENLQYIGERAFAGCTHLEDASLPASVMDIGEYAFMDCDLWEGVSLYEQAKIGLGAFAGTSNAAPDGYIFLMDSEGRTTPSYFGEHCPQAIVK